VGVLINSIEERLTITFHLRTSHIGEGMKRYRVGWKGSGLRFLRNSSSLCLISMAAHLSCVIKVYPQTFFIKNKR
jgi:hypothetical protein